MQFVKKIIFDYNIIMTSPRGGIMPSLMPVPLAVLEELKQTHRHTQTDRQTDRKNCVLCIRLRLISPFEVVMFVHLRMFAVVGSNIWVSLETKKMGKRKAIIFLLP